MPITIEDFSRPDRHPYSMLTGLGMKHAYEAEAHLAWHLCQIVDRGWLGPLECKHEHPRLVNAGLLIDHGGKVYELTRKALALLYAEYGKADVTL